jgi:hypothetical protein
MHGRRAATYFLKKSCGEMSGEIRSISGWALSLKPGSARTNKQTKKKKKKKKKKKTPRPQTG